MTDLSIAGGDFNLGTGSATTTLTSASGRLGIASTSPWGLFSVESDNSSVGTNNPIFVVGDQGTSTPFLYVSGKDGNVGVGTKDTGTAKLNIRSGTISKSAVNGANPVTIVHDINSVPTSADTGFGGIAISLDKATNLAVGDALGGITFGGGGPLEGGRFDLAWRQLGHFPRLLRAELLRFIRRMRMLPEYP